MKTDSFALRHLGPKRFTKMLEGVETLDQLINETI
jgi:hypothetical protein